MISRYLNHKITSVIILLMLGIFYGISYRFQKKSEITELNFVENQYAGIRDFFQYNCQKQLRSVNNTLNQNHSHFIYYFIN
jgi:hypothetical protein